MNKDIFNFFVPLDFEKGGEGGELVKIKGVASTDAEDSDKETLIPAGFDFEPLLKSGFLNWNHQARTTSKAICGEPTSAKIVNGGKDFYIEGVLYPNEEGKRVAELADTLAKYSTTRRLGFSIEGQAIERDILNPKRVLKARITGVAITQCPKNPNTLMDIVKGEYSEEFVEGDEEENKEQVDKAMMANPDLNPPSIEGVKHTEELNQVLKKSDIYSQIYERYTDNFEKAEQIHEFINTVKEKTMSQEVTQDVLNKAFGLLDASLLEKAGEQKQPGDYDKKDEINGGGDAPDGKPENKEVEKSEEAKKEEEEALAKAKAEAEGEDDDDDDFEKSMDAEIFAKSLFDQGKTQDEVVKSMTSCGVNLTLAETAAANCIAQANEAKDGGTVTVLKKGDEENDLQKSFEAAFDPIKDMIEQKFGAVTTILKSFGDEIATVKQTQTQFLGQPQPRKSATTARAVEKFEKSEDGSGSKGINVYDVRDINDVRALSDRLFNETNALRAAGTPNLVLEKAMSDLEIAKSTDWNVAEPALRRLNIGIQR